MTRPKAWNYSEEKFLLDNYKKLTIKELEARFPNRTRESIYNKIKRLKREGKITSGLEPEARLRAYSQRGKDLVKE